MARYIDPSKIKLTGLTFEDINNEVYFSLTDVRKAIEQTPTADVVEVRHGEWKPIDPESDVRFFCSKCETEISTSWDYDEAEMWRYCPCCGAKMDGERKEQG